MDKPALTPLGPQKPFELPAHFEVWLEAVTNPLGLTIFKTHLKVGELCRTLESKAFRPANDEAAARAWLEFMSLTGNIIITSIMPPDMLIRFAPTEGGGMRILEKREGE